MKTDLFIEFGSNQVDTKKLYDMAKEIWKSEGKKVKDLETVSLYFKPEENRCYYVFNGEETENNYFEV